MLIFNVKGIILIAFLSFLFFLKIGTPYKILPKDYKDHGTLVIAIICYDGIIMASDSRGSFIERLPNGKEHPFAYIDSMQKIFFLKNYSVAITGVSMVNKKYYYQFLEEFNHSDSQDSNFGETFANFKSFLSTKYGINDSILFDNNFFISGFYENHIAKLVGYRKNDSLITSAHNGMLFSADNAKQSFFNLYDSYKLPLTCENGAFLAEKAIYKFAIDSNKTSEVGGPISIIKISPDNSITYIKSFNPKTYKDYKDFANSILKNETKVVYTDPLGPQKLKDAINNVLKAWY